MRNANRFRLDYEEPTLDPVELERQLMAEAKAEAEAARRGSGWTLLGGLAVLVSGLAVAAYIAVWASNVGGAGGPEGYVLSTGFISTLTGAELVRRGNGPSLYDPDAQRVTQAELRGPGASNQKLVPYDRPPFEALLVAPLLALPSWLVFAFWTLAAGGFAIGLAVGLMDNALPVSRQTGWVLSLAACSFFPVVRTLMLGGGATLVLLGLCGTYMALKSGREVLAAGSLLLVAFEPQMLPVFLLALLLQRRFATLTFFLVFLAAMCALVMPVLGVGWPADYLRFLADGGWGGFYLPNMQNWHGFTELLFGYTALELVAPVYLLLVLGTLAPVVWAWRRSQGHAPALGEDVEDEDEEEDDEPDGYEPRTDLLWALAAVAAVLVAVFSNPQDLALLVFPAWIIGAYAAQAGWIGWLSSLWVAVLWAGYGLAPLTLYSPRDAVAVVPPVLLLVLAAGLLAWMLASGPPQVEGYELVV